MERNAIAIVSYGHKSIAFDFYSVMYQWCIRRKKAWLEQSRVHEAKVSCHNSPPGKQFFSVRHATDQVLMIFSILTADAELIYCTFNIKIALFSFLIEFSCYQKKNQIIKS